MCELLKTLPQMIKLGEGNQGTIYDVGNNQVMKVTYEKINKDILYMASRSGIAPRIFGFEECPDGRTYYIQQKLFNTYNEKYLSQVSELVTRMFEAGLYHNDLRDDNMMADEKGKLYLIDFDLSNKISNYGSRYFDKSVKKHSWFEHDGRDVHIEFTPIQMKRIQAMRPTIEITQGEIDSKNRVENARKLAIEQNLERQRQAAERLRRK